MPTPSDLRISAVICTRNRPDMIGDAVGSVLANDHPSFELVVIDQSDTDAIGEALSARFARDHRLRYVHTDRVGLSAAYNAGIAAAHAPVIAFTDDDCIAESGWLTSVEAAFTANPDVHLLYGQVLRPASFSGEGVLPAIEFARPFRIAKPGPLRIFGMGANFAARRELFERIGGFDEVLGGGGPLRSSQDSDFLYRVYRAGLVTLMEPSVRVEHHGLRTNAQWPLTLFAYGVGDGGFYMKHARCGDPASMYLFAKKTARVFGRAFGRRRAYFRGYLAGMKGSFHYRIDRSRRTYVGP